MIINWMTNGEIVDKYDEFFIMETLSENYCDIRHILRFIKNEIN